MLRLPCMHLMDRDEMAYPKLYRLVQKLSDLTQSSRIDWQEASELGVYQVTFSGAFIRIRQDNADIVISVIDDTSINICNSAGIR